MRIVSLLPSATEIICELGLGDQLVGVSHECDYPAFVRRLPKVTQSAISPLDTSQQIDAAVREKLKTESALYSLDAATLERLQPDLIVTQTLCNVCAVAESEVRAAACELPRQARIVNLEPIRLADIFDCLRLVGEAAGVSDRAEHAIVKLRARVEAVETRTRTSAARARVVFLEWIDPPFCAGHWTPELIRLAGGVELLGREGEPSRTTSWDEIVSADPEVLFVACCGFDVERTAQDLAILSRQPGFGRLSCAQSGRVYWSDGSAYFNRPGPRLIDSLELVAHALHPDVHPLPSDLPAARRLAGSRDGSATPRRA